MDQKIAFGCKILSDRSNNCNNIFGKTTVIITLLPDTSDIFRGVKVRNDGWRIRVIIRRLAADQIPFGVYQPDGSVRVGFDTTELCADFR